MNLTSLHVRVINKSVIVLTAVALCDSNVTQSEQHWVQTVINKHQQSELSESHKLAQCSFSIRNCP